jgi:hypothetical protein
MPAYQLFSFLLYVYLYAKLLHMPATDSILSISLYVYGLVQSFILAGYMPVLYAYHSAIVSMPVNMSSSVSTYMPKALSHMLCVICRLSYAKARMPVLYVECHVLAIASLLSYQFICLFQYQFLHALC